MKTVALIALLAVMPLACQSVADRIVHKDPAKYRAAKSVHGGPGELAYMSMLDDHALTANLFFFHRGVIKPKSGIGHHYHHRMEEMFVIFDNEAQFTIDGRTSLLKGPAGAPCKMGHSHAIYNHTDKPTEWMNIAITERKGKYDAFDLADGRLGVALDPVPVFVTLKMDRKLLRPEKAMNGGAGTALQRRALPPEVFGTNWAYVDHAVLPAQASIGAHRHRGVEEVYYVVSGAGAALVNGQRAALRKDDVLPVKFNEVHSIEAGGSGELELLVFGITLQRGILDTEDVR